MMEDRKKIVVENRMEKVLKEERIIVIDNGRIVEEGKKERIVEKGGIYERIEKMKLEEGEGEFDEKWGGGGI